MKWKVPSLCGLTGRSSNISGRINRLVLLPLPKRSVAKGYQDENEALHISNRYLLRSVSAIVGICPANSAADRSAAIPVGLAWSLAYVWRGLGILVDLPVVHIVDDYLLYGPQIRLWPP